MNYEGKIAGPVIKRVVCDDEEGPAAAGLLRLCDDLTKHLSGADSPLSGAEGGCVVTFSRSRTALTSKVLVDGKMREVSRPCTIFRAQLWLNAEAKAQ